MIHPWHEPAWAAFRLRLAQGRMPHGLLLSGPEATAKGDLARAMAARLLCLQTGDHACGACRSCALLKGGAHPDRFELAPEEGKHQVTIGQVRALLSALCLTTTISQRKVALIAPAEAMNHHAANALLKNLEEPPGDAVLILLSHDPGRLAVTLRSRCQSIVAQAPTREQALEWLQARGGPRGEEACRALQAANGSPVRALELHASGLAEAWSQLAQRLRELRGRPAAAGACAAALADIEPVLLWRWLSQASAQALREELSRRGDPGPVAARRLARLQQRADENRELCKGGVRQDLLLQEWLLEWAAQPLARTG